MLLLSAYFVSADASYFYKQSEVTAGGGSYTIVTNTTPIEALKEPIESEKPIPPPPKIDSILPIIIQDNETK